MAPSEPLARYLVYKRGYFSVVEKRVKRRAFMPAPQDNETSVFRILGLTDSMIWTIGKSYVADPQQRPLYGRADILASQVTEVGLATIARDDPPRHAGISGWPIDEGEQISLAQELAELAVLQLRPE